MKKDVDDKLQKRAVEIAEEKQIKKIENAIPDKLVNVPTMLQPLSCARKLIIHKISEYLSNSKEFEADDQSILFVTVFVLSEKDPLKLMKLSREPSKFFKKAVAMADGGDEKFEAKMDEAMQLLTSLDEVESLLAEDEHEGEEPTQLEKK